MHVGVARTRGGLRSDDVQGRHDLHRHRTGRLQRSWRCPKSRRNAESSCCSTGCECTCRGGHACHLHGWYDFHGYGSRRLQWSRRCAEGLEVEEQTRRRLDRSGSNGRSAARCVGDASRAGRFCTARRRTPCCGTRKRGQVVDGFEIGA
jgi:hypothetical protein